MFFKAIQPPELFSHQLTLCTVKGGSGERREVTTCDLDSFNLETEQNEC